MNPETNRFEEIQGDQATQRARDEFERMMKRRIQAFFYRNDIKGKITEVPVFEVGEEVVLRGYRFTVSIIEPGRMVLEPAGVSIDNTRVRRGSKKSRGKSQKRRKSGSRKKRGCNCL